MEKKVPAHALEPWAVTNSLDDAQRSEVEELLAKHYNALLQGGKLSAYDIRVDLFDAKAGLPMWDLTSVPAGTISENTRIRVQLETGDQVWCRPDPSLASKALKQFTKKTSISEAQLRAEFEAFVAAEFEAFKGAAKSSLAPAKGLRRSRSQTQASLSALPVVDFCAEQVQAAFDIFDNREAGFGHVVVLKLQDDVGLKKGCDALLQTDHVFTSHTNAGITFQGLEKECFSRVEHGLHEHKVRRRRKEVFAEPLTTLVEAHFEGTAFKEAWDTVANIIKERWPKRQPLLVLMATGDCSKLSGHTTHGNVTFSASGQLVLCHFDGFHVVCFTVKGRKDFRVAKHADIEALPDSANANEAHHVSASHTDYAHLFSAAQVPEGHVMIMEVKTWHEVRSVLRHLRSVEFSRVLNLVLVLYSHRCGRHPMAP